MEIAELQKELLKSGYKSYLANTNRARIKPPGLSNPVSITYDIAVKEYQIKTNDLVLTLMNCIVLVSGLYLSQVGNLIISSILIGSSVFSFISIVLTEMKIKDLREYIRSLNAEKCI